MLDFREGSAYFKNYGAQAAAVAGCSVLLGPHGAGLAHLVWMTRGALVELLGSPEGKVSPCFPPLLTCFQG